jgi:hypothetical protein
MLDNLSSSPDKNDEIEGMTCSVAVVKAKEEEGKTEERLQGCNEQLAAAAYGALLSWAEQDMSPEKAGEIYADVQAALNGPLAHEFKNMVLDPTKRTELRALLKLSKQNPSPWSPDSWASDQSVMPGEGHNLVWQNPVQTPLSVNQWTDISPELQAQLEQAATDYDHAIFDNEEARINREIAQEDYYAWQESSFYREFNSRRDEYKQNSQDDQDGDDEENNKYNKNSNLSSRESSYNSNDEGGSSPAWTTRVEKINTFIERERGSGSTVWLEYVSSGDRESWKGKFILMEEGAPVTSDKWKSFPTRKQAIRAKIWYELFSDPPLTAIRDLWPKAIQDLMNNQELRSIWNQENPGESFRGRWLRRLFLISMIKKMDIGYRSKSYDEVLKWQGRPLSEQFWSKYQLKKSTLGLLNNGSAPREILDRMIEIVKEVSQWSKEKPSQQENRYLESLSKGTYW